VRVKTFGTEGKKRGDSARLVEGARYGLHRGTSIGKKNTLLCRQESQSGAKTKGKLLGRRKRFSRDGKKTRHSYKSGAGWKRSRRSERKEIGGVDFTRGYNKGKSREGAKKRASSTEEGAKTASSAKKRERGGGERASTEKVFDHRKVRGQQGDCINKRLCE